jgi:hypothetical protein
LRGKFKCISAYNLILYLPWYYLCISYYSYTCWVQNISIFNIAIFPCYSNLLFRRIRLTEILWRWVLGYVLPRLPFLWSYEAFCCSILLRVVIVFRDIIYIRTIFYLWHLVFCEHFWPYVWNNWFWIIHSILA